VSDQSKAFANPFNEPRQGIVDAAGLLTIRFGPPYNNTWEVQQVSIEMPTAPAGATCELRYMASLIAPSPSAKRASAGGDPPIFLQGGETMTVEWRGCTPGDIGRVLFVYRKGLY
jgi:hypothetical protein